ncbi:MAG: hypothetical protein GDA50_02140 [Alphaproteobacteria bacterium GM202ARS2]|nr:hypothetical protein [Alphaproteobacteria bacterium GM202ARS2]
MLTEWTYCDTADWLGGAAQSWNVLSNAGFFLLAALVWRQPSARSNRFGLVAIGIASSLWHATAASWALLIDISAILTWTALFIYDVRRFYTFSLPLAYGAWLVFIAVSAISGFLLVDVLPLLSGAFVPYVLLLVLAPYLLPLSVHERASCWLGSVALSIGIIAREVDSTLCAFVPIGTHILWHLSAAVVTAVPIVVLYRRAQGRLRPAHVIV